MKCDVNIGGRVRIIGLAVCFFIGIAGGVAAEEIGDPLGIFLKDLPPPAKKTPEDTSSKATMKAGDKTGVNTDDNAVSTAVEESPETIAKKEREQADKDLKEAYREVRKSFDWLFKKGKKEKAQNENGDPGEKGKQDKEPFRPVRRVVVYEGYSEEYMQTKKLICSGELEQIQGMYADEERELASKSETPEELMREIGLLGLYERGALSLHAGDSDQAIRYFGQSEELMRDREGKSKASQSMNKGGVYLLETLSGRKGIGPYWGEGFERILMLNYKTIAFLLQGDRRAYNVTRRAIDWQAMEKRLFEEKIKKAEKKMAEAEEKKRREQEEAEKIQQEEMGAKGQEQAEEEKNISTVDINNMLREEYSATDAIASTVASAFVNPFGYYVAGMVLEFEGYDDPSLRHNAWIAYSKALALNPSSEILQQAVKDMKQDPPSGDKKLVHVVVGDGFVPEKKVLVLGLGTEDIVVPVKLPIYEPSPTQVHRIEVYDSGGGHLARLSPLADLEALCLRHQKDMLPMYTLNVSVDAARIAVERLILHRAGVLGHVAGAVHDEMSIADTRSWMSLPASFQAVRLYLPRGEKLIKLVTFDKAGKRLASTSVDLDTASHNFIFARSIDRVLHAYSNKTLWLAENN